MLLLLFTFVAGTFTRNALQAELAQRSDFEKYILLTVQSTPPVLSFITDLFNTDPFRPNRPDEAITALPENGRQQYA